MNEQNNSRPNPDQQSPSSRDDRSAIPLGQGPTGEASPGKSPAGEQHQDQELQGQQPQGQAHENAEGAIPKAVEAIEKAADKGLEKTSGVVGSTIDKVADAAISALGGRPDQNHNS
ncbi:hypothetical protein [Sphingomonas sp. LHG3406-1]|uniref:hypothetical protein n=1 Tax=Sphingomonas sp. LHG3406-1 TaxID=2804617 RepID=UPI002616BB8A|nr:hypothetical protein [Sphingomonas sp. LHG3406-1]